jgi:hypothetical protein
MVSWLRDLLSEAWRGLCRRGTERLAERIGGARPSGRGPGSEGPGPPGQKRPPASRPGPGRRQQSPDASPGASAQCEVRGSGPGGEVAEAYAGGDGKPEPLVAGSAPGGSPVAPHSSLESPAAQETLAGPATAAGATSEAGALNWSELQARLRGLEEKVEGLEGRTGAGDSLSKAEDDDVVQPGQPQGLPGQRPRACERNGTWEGVL